MIKRLFSFFLISFLVILILNPNAFAFHKKKAITKTFYEDLNQMEVQSQYCTSDVKKAKKFSHKFMYIFGPPGWSPDGSTLTVKEQQRLFKKHKQTNPGLAYQRPN